MAAPLGGSAGCTVLLPELSALIAEPSASFVWRLLLLAPCAGTSEAGVSLAFDGGDSAPVKIEHREGASVRVALQILMA